MEPRPYDGMRRPPQQPTGTKKCRERIGSPTLKTRHERNIRHAVGKTKWLSTAPPWNRDRTTGITLSWHANRNRMRLAIVCCRFCGGTTAQTWRQAHESGWLESRHKCEALHITIRSAISCVHAGIGRDGFIDRSLLNNHNSGMAVGRKEEPRHDGITIDDNTLLACQLEANGAGHWLPF